MMAKKKNRREKELGVLFGMVELFIKIGKPIGSNTLKESGFQSISSATIRNYFAKLETDGYLKQPHSSGGRIPTSKAIKWYANEVLKESRVALKSDKFLSSKLETETKEVSAYLEKSLETISQYTNCAAFLSLPRFDQDFIVDVKLVSIDKTRVLAVIVTDFGNIRTETLYLDSKKLSSFLLKRIESYFRFRMTGLDKPKLSKEEEKMAHQFYHEIFLRHVVGYSNFGSEDVLKVGFSRLLHYPEFLDVKTLANGLSLFENTNFLSSVLSSSAEKKELSVLVGDDLDVFIPSKVSCSVVVVPYYIHNKIVGSLAVLGPTRVPYNEIFTALTTAANAISKTLTNSLYKYKITYRKPKAKEIEFQSDSNGYMDHAQFIVLEDKSEEGE